MPEHNPLEAALKKALTDPEAREAFYRELMAAQVHVVGREEPQPDGSPAHVQLKQWEQPGGQMALPFFTCEEHLRQLLGPDEPSLRLPAVELFKAAGELTLVLTTPEGSKEFQPDEIAALMSSAMALDPLAKALAAAAQEATEEARQKFYQVLINSQVFVLGRPQDESAVPGSAPRQIRPDDQFLIHACPHPLKKDEKALPFFSSLEHLKRVAPPQSQYMGFAALQLFALSREMKLPLLLNPGFAVHKLFAEEEVEFLMNAAKQEPFEERRYEPGSKVYLGPPEKYPQAMIAALLDFLPNYPQVSAAYLTAMREGREDADPILVFGFEAEGDLTPMFREAGPLLHKYAQDDTPIDFARVEEGSQGLSRYFLDKVSPFYRKALPGAQRSPEAPRPQAVEKYESGGLFGGLKRMFGGSKK